MGGGPRINRDNDPDFLRLQASILQIKAHRIDMGISQTKAAELMGTSQSAVSDIETLGVDPQISTYMRYARACGVKVHLSVMIPRDDNA